MIRLMYLAPSAGFLLASSIGCSGRDEPPAVSVYRLDGTYQDKLHMAEESGETLERPKQMFREWPVLERRRVANAALAQELASAIEKGANFGGPPAACFWPGFGIAVGEGDEQIDAVICLQCNWLYRFRRAGEERLPLSERGAAELKRLYQQTFPDEPQPPANE